MTLLSKDAEIILLRDAFARISDPPSWPLFFSKVDEFLDCTSFAVEYGSNHSPDSGFSGRDKAEEIARSLRQATSDGESTAFDFLLHKAAPEEIYQLLANHLSASDGKHGPSTDGDAPKRDRWPSVIGVLKRKSLATLLVGFSFPALNNSQPLAPETIASCRKVIGIFKLALAAFDDLARAWHERHAYEAMTRQSGTPSVLINHQNDILAETPPGLETLTALDAAASKDGKLLFQNRLLEIEVQAILARGPKSDHSGQPDRKAAEAGTNEADEDRRGIFLKDGSGLLHRITFEQLASQPAGTASWILIRVLQPAQIHETVEAILQAEFGLSQSEARLAHQLAVTGSVAETIELLDITRNTMKTHLRRIFDKTGTHTQLELVQLVHRLAGLV